MFILVISLSLSFLIISLEQNAYNKDYFLNSYKKYNIEDITSKSIEELDVITIDLIKYLKTKGSNELLETHFNEKEVLHMVDVQNLFNLARMIKYISIAISLGIIFYFIKEREYRALGNTLLYGLLSNYLVLMILTLFLLTDFNKYFTYFHLIFFTNDLWLLDPNTDLMIQMLPEEFFIGMAKNIGLSFFVYLAIIQVIGYFILRRDKNGKIYRKTKGQLFKK